MSQISFSDLPDKNIQKETAKEKEKTPERKKRRYSSISSDSDMSFISNINAEIKNIVENEEDLSFSSNSEQESTNKKSDIEYLLDPKFWKASKDSWYDNEFNQEKKIFGMKKFSSDGKKHGKNGFDESNKQSTQENEDEDLRDEHLHNISSSESNITPLNSLGNNENSENEMHSDKIKKEKNENNELNDKKIQNKFNLNEQGLNDIIKNNNADNYNIISPNILMDDSNFANTINFKNINSDSKFIYPFDSMNYISNQSGPNYFQNSFLPQNYMKLAAKYNLPSPLGSRNIISLNNDNNNKSSKLLNEKNEYNSEQNVKNDNINGQNNKIVNSTNNDYNKKISPYQKDIIGLPLIINQNNSQNMPLNYSNSPKLNLNMTYYPKIQNHSLQMNKQSIAQSSSSNLLPELKDSHNTTNINNNNNNFQEKNQKNSNSMPFEAGNINNKLQINNKADGNNNYIYQNNKMKNGFNKNMNNVNNNKGQKGEKQFLNLDNIASGKDIRTTIMIRNIPIKYTDEILNETFKDFHGKYDCLYMPYDYEKNGNKGYAFINFVNPLHILLFHERFNGKKWVHFESPKICELNMAHFQGVNEIQKHAKNFKGLKKVSYNNINENIVIPIKYFSKIKSRFPKMKYENKNKKEFLVKSFE